MSVASEPNDDLEPTIDDVIGYRYLHPTKDIKGTFEPLYSAEYYKRLEKELDDATPEPISEEEIDQIVKDATRKQPE